MKKLISVFLSVTMILSLIIPAFAVQPGECNCGRDPLVYVVGRMNVYSDPTSEELIPAVNASTDVITGAVKKALPSLAKAVVTDEWDEYCEKLCEIVAPIYEDYALSETGELKETSKSGVLHYSDTDEITDWHGTDTVYGFEFDYDPRIDPMVNADRLNTYIERVKEITGHSSVNLICRCLGSAVAMAYLVKYASKNNFRNISTFVINNGTINGFAFISDFFSGNLEFDANAIERYASEQLGDDLLGEFLKLTVSTFNRTYGLKLGVLGIEKFYEKIRDKAFPQLVFESYGTCPGYWSMISDRRYEEAKEFVFGSRDGDYSKIISKIDNYHYNVQVKTVDTLKAMEKAGVHLGIICKYGYQLVPLTSKNNCVSDNTIDLDAQSFGAYSSTIDSVLTDRYLETADKKYISPDNQIDASTCLFPDYTWFVKDLTHYDFPDGESILLVAICRYDGQMTIDSDPNYPQYLLYDAEMDSMSPLTAENCNTRNYGEPLIYKFIRVLKLIFNGVIALFNKNAAIK